MTSEEPYIVMGACLDCWQTGPRRDKQCEVEDNVLLNFFMGVCETQLAQAGHFLHEHLENAPTSRMKALREPTLRRDP